MSTRVCFVLGGFYEDSNGGAELQAYMIAEGLARLGYDIHYVSPKARAVAVVDRQEYPKHPFITHKIKNRHYRFLGRLFWLNSLELSKTLRDIDPDVIYSRSGSAFAGVAARYAGKYKKKTIWAASSVKDCRRSSLCEDNRNPLASFLNIFNKRLAAYGIRKANVVIAQTADQRDLLAQEFGVAAEVIPNAHPVPPDKFKKEEPPLIAWIANIKPLKRPELFVRLALACQSLPGRFLMVGREGNPRHQAQLMALVSEAKNLKYLGQLPLEQANELLEKASVLVSTSLPVEGFPNTFVQAWLRRVPTVSLEFDPDKMIQQEGLGFCAANFDELVGDVKALITDENLRHKLGSRAREYAASKLDLAVVLPRYVAIIDDLGAMDADE